MSDKPLPIPVEAFHPGEYLIEEMCARLAISTGLTIGQLEAVATGRSRMTEQIASGLEKAWGTSRHTWMSLQKAYDDHQAAYAPKKVASQDHSRNVSDDP